MLVSIHKNLEYCFAFCDGLRTACLSRKNVNGTFIWASKRAKQKRVKDYCYGDIYAIRHP
jgi:hypothetical protein